MAWQAEQVAQSLVPGPAGEGLETSYEHSWSIPPWVTVVWVLAAALIVSACYWRERGIAGALARLGLAGLRLVLVGLVIWMLYGWARQRHRTDLPDLVVIIDDSQSMATIDTWDDDDVRHEWLQRLRQQPGGEASRFNLVRQVLEGDARPWHEWLAARYHVKWFLAGERLRAVSEPESGSALPALPRTPAEVSSRLGQAVLDALQLQRGRPTAAIVVLTDGITTDGPTISEAAQFARRRQTPLYVVGIGSEQPPRDVRLADLQVDDVAFVHDDLTFDVQLSAQGYAGRTVRLRLRRDDEPDILAETQVTVAEADSTQTVRLTYRPPAEGHFEFRVEAAPLPGEVNLANNVLQREVTVTEETVRVLLIQSAPSYEYRYLKGLLGRSLTLGSRSGKKAIELNVLLQEADWEYASDDPTSLRVFPVSRDELFQYDVIVLGDANPAPLGVNALRMVADFVQTRGGGLIVLAGPRFTPQAYHGTPLAEVLPCSPDNVTLPDPSANLVSGFRPRLTVLGAGASPLQLADAPAANAQLWSHLPPLFWLAAVQEIKPGVRVLAEHPTQLAADGRNLPVVTLQFSGAGKILFHATDDLWRWSRDAEFEPAYSRYWLQWLRYLSRAKLQSGSRSVQLTTDREEYERGEPVRVRVRFVDERMAPARDDAVSVMVQREGAGRRTVTLARDRTDRGLFEASVSQLADGRYRVGVLSPALDETPEPVRFSIVAPPGEQSRLEMDGPDLRAAARRSDGKYYTLRTVAGLLDDLPPGRQVRIESLPAEPLWNRWPVAALFVLVIIGEWLGRKRLGML